MQPNTVIPPTTQLAYLFNTRNPAARRNKSTGSIMTTALLTRQQANAQTQPSLLRLDGATASIISLILSTVRSLCKYGRPVRASKPIQNANRDQESTKKIFCSPPSPLIKNQQQKRNKQTKTTKPTNRTHKIHTHNIHTNTWMDQMGLLVYKKTEKRHNPTKSINKIYIWRIILVHYGVLSYHNNKL